jgi:hypothetical protein
MQPHETLDPRHRGESDDAEDHHSGDRPADESPIADYTTPEHPEHPQGPEWAADTRPEDSTSDDPELTPDDDDTTRLGYGEPGHPVSGDGAPGYESTAYETHEAGAHVPGGYEGEHRVGGGHEFDPETGGPDATSDEGPDGTDETADGVADDGTPGERFGLGADEAEAGDEAQTDVVPAQDAAADAAPDGAIDGHAAAAEPYQGQPYDSSGPAVVPAGEPVLAQPVLVEPVAVESDGVESDGVESDGVESDGVASDGVASDEFESDEAGRYQDDQAGEPSDVPAEVAAATAAAGAPATGSAATAAVPADALPGAGEAAAATPLVSDAERLRNRWRDVQASFVDDPADAVRAAGELVEEAVQAMVASLHQQRETLEATGGEARTEQQRVALRRYRTVFERLLNDESASS